MNDLSYNLSNQDGAMSDDHTQHHNHDFSSMPDSGNQDFNQNFADNLNQQQLDNHHNFPTDLTQHQDFSQAHSLPDLNHQFQDLSNSHSLSPEISNFHQDQQNLNLHSPTWENPNLSLSNHQLEFNSSLESQHSAFTTQVLNYSDNQYPYTTIDNSGHIDLHTKDDIYGHSVGYLSGRHVYNSSHYHLGYAGTDGNVYDNHDKVVGWVDNNGNIYNTGGCEVHHTSKGVVGAAAYLLCSYYGGAN